MHFVILLCTQAKDVYYSRCQEFEKVKKETTNAKDIEKVCTLFTLHNCTVTVVK